MAKTIRPVGGNYIVLNPRGIPSGRHIIKYHTCAPSMKNEPDAAKHAGVCTVKLWYEGDAFNPPAGFGVERFVVGGFLKEVR